MPLTIHLAGSGWTGINPLSVTALAAIEAELRHALAGSHHAVVDVSANRAVLDLAGPGVTDLLLGQAVLERIIRDIKVAQRELPIDLLEFFFLTPLPGSEDTQMYPELCLTIP